MARIDAVTPEQASPLTRLAFRQAERQMGKLPEPFAVTAHHFKLMGGYAGFELALDRSHAVDDKLKALGELKAAVMAGCEFCIDIGTMISRRHGVSERQLRELGSYRDSDAFSPLEKLVVEYAEGMTRTPVEVSDELVAELRKHFDERQLVELTAAIAIENYRARFNWALGIGSQGFTREGDFCPLPESSRSPSQTA
jgi:AhpD family alkylhydroperoxidase